MINIVLIGYSGHSHVVYDCLKSMGHEVKKYCDSGVKNNNILTLEYLGLETEERALKYFRDNNFFVSKGKPNITM